jgi:maltooligosyltrehalose trehalohydrolase
MLFQGQEFGATTPFLYFADHNPELAAQVAHGRAEFLSQFPSIASSPEIAALIPNPELEETFQSSKLSEEERTGNTNALALHRDLIALRKATPHIAGVRNGTYDGAVLGPSAFLLRYFGPGQDDRLLIVNLGPALHLDPAPEPLLAPVNGRPWKLLWSSEDPRYGGGGTPALDTDDNWRIPAETAAFLGPTI